MSENSPQHEDQQGHAVEPIDPAEALRQQSLLSEEVAGLRRRLADSPTRSRDLENRVLQLQTALSTLSSQNERLVRTLREAREQIVTLKGEVDRLAQPPSAYGLILESYDDATVDILTGGRKMRVAVSPSVDPGELSAGREVMLNEALNVVATCGFERLASDGAASKVCVVPGQSHSGIVGARSGYVNDWIASVAQGAAAPVPCADDERSLQANGVQVECATPPPNE